MPPPPAAAADAPAAVACKGPGLTERECGLVNRAPLPAADFRGLPRRVEAGGGVVTADSSRCSEAGAGILGEGGNAVDAAVATALCLGVVNPVASGLVRSLFGWFLLQGVLLYRGRVNGRVGTEGRPGASQFTHPRNRNTPKQGGGAFILIRLANGTSDFINAREPAPAAANATMYSGLPKSASLDGGLAVGIPCELRGLEAAWRRHGRLPWGRLVAPAAALARSGFGAHVSAGGGRVLELSCRC